MLLWPEQQLEKITKADIVAFAQKLVRTDNYGIVFKHHGEDKSVMKVDKPPITPIEVNRSDMSGFAQNFLEQTSADIEPQFVDFKELIKTSAVFKNLKLRAVHNKATQLFRLASQVRRDPAREHLADARHGPRWIADRTAPG